MIDQISGKVKCHVPLRLNFLQIRRKIHLKLISAVSCITVFTARKRSFRRLCFYTCVYVHRGEYQAGTPWQVHPSPPPGRYPLSGTPPWAGTPPFRSSACWEIRATIGRYASSWNAFLLWEIFFVCHKVGALFVCIFPIVLNIIQNFLLLVMMHHLRYRQCNDGDSK